MAPISVNIGGTYREMSDGWVNINGVWRQIASVHNNINGVWKEGYSGSFVGSVLVSGENVYVFEGGFESDPANNITTTPTILSFPGRDMRSVATTNGIWVIRDNSSKDLLVTKDFKTINIVPSTFGGSIHAVDGKFYAANASKVLCSSVDGVNWTEKVTTSYGFSRGIAHNGGNIIVAKNLSTTVAISTDRGATFSIQPITGAYSVNHQMGYGNGYFFDIKLPDLHYSTDGINWTTKTASPSSNSATAQLYYGGYYHAISGNANYTTSSLTSPSSSYSNTTTNYNDLIGEKGIVYLTTRRVIKKKNSLTSTFSTTVYTYPDGVDNYYLDVASNVDEFA